MIRLKLQEFLDGTQLRRPFYRATCKDGKTRLGYLCFYVKKHWLRPATEIVYLRENITGKLYRFRPETLALWTQLWDYNHKPICNGDHVLRRDSYTGATLEGDILYCRDIAGFVWNCTDGKYKRVEPLYGDLSVTDGTHEFQVQYTYEIVRKHLKKR